MIFRKFFFLIWLQSSKKSGNGDLFKYVSSKFGLQNCPYCHPTQGKDTVKLFSS
jgi:hypothetical protein